MERNMKKKQIKITNVPKYSEIPPSMNGPLFTSISYVYMYIYI